MVDLWRDFWIRETGTCQQVVQLHDRYMMMILLYWCHCVLAVYNILYKKICVLQIPISVLQAVSTFLSNSLGNVQHGQRKSWSMTLSTWHCQPHEQENLQRTIGYTSLHSEELVYKNVLLTSIQFPLCPGILNYMCNKTDFVHRLFRKQPSIYHKNSRRRHDTVKCS